MCVAVSVCQIGHYATLLQTRRLMVECAIPGDHPLRPSLAGVCDGLEIGRCYSAPYNASAGRLMVSAVSPGSRDARPGESAPWRSLARRWCILAGQGERPSAASSLITCLSSAYHSSFRRKGGVHLLIGRFAMRVSSPNDTAAGKLVSAGGGIGVLGEARWSWDGNLYTRGVGIGGFPGKVGRWFWGRGFGWR